MEKKPKANIYIDGANMFYAQQKMGWFIDWQKIKVWLEKKYQIKEIRFYSGIKSGDRGLEKFLKKIQSYGFTVIAKPLKKIYLGKKQVIFKANFDVEMAVDLVLDCAKFDWAIIFSGDSDFNYVIKKLQNFKKKVLICSSYHALSSELRKSADKCILLGSVRNKIELIKSPRSEDRG